MSLLLTIFLLVFVAELIKWIGQTVLLDFAFELYTYLIASDAARRSRALKSAILDDQKQLAQTSAQDEFAKWAKLRRKVDKGLADLEKLNNELSAVKAAFAFKFNSALWILINGSQFIVGWWYRKNAVFYLPPGWFGPLQWTLALPFAPKGSVSCGVWQMACRRSIRFVESIVRDLIINSSVQEAAAIPEGKAAAGKVPTT